MFGRPYNLLMQHALYRALPHREGGGVPRDVVTGHYDREAVRAQLRKELRSIRNADMFAHLAAHVVRLHARKGPAAASLPACIIARASARPPVTPTAARTVASLLHPHRIETIDYRYAAGATETRCHPERSEAPAVATHSRQNTPLNLSPVEDTEA
jgi:hypothetical protein